MRNVVLVGTAVTRPNSVGTLFRLDPGGDWNTVEGIPPDASVQAITPHPERDNVVYAAARKGIYRSTDSGQTWQRLKVTDDDVQFWSLAVHPKNPEVLVAGSAPVGFYRSDDGGGTWRRCGPHHPDRYNLRFGHSRAMRVAFSPADPRVLYCAGEINGFYVSEDGGESWRLEASGLEELVKLPHLKNKIETDDLAEGIYDAHAVCTTPAAPDSVFYVCRMGLFESKDLGRTWRDLEVGKQAPFDYSRDMRIVAGQPRHAYACFSISSRSEAGALFQTEDLGATWRRAMPHDAPSTVMGFGLHVTDPAGGAGVTRAGQVYYSTDASQTWAEKQLPANAGDGFCAAIL
jgi:photosystem II stability/assembly factor-like uncharacterized protein